MTSRGLKEEDFDKVAGFLEEVLRLVTAAGADDVFGRVTACFCAELCAVAAAFFDSLLVALHAVL